MVGNTQEFRMSNGYGMLKISSFLEHTRGNQEMALHITKCAQGRELQVFLSSNESEDGERIPNSHRFPK